jgi:hypothetical protein
MKHFIKNLKELFAPKSNLTNEYNGVWEGVSKNFKLRFNLHITHDNEIKGEGKIVPIIDSEESKGHIYINLSGKVFPSKVRIINYSSADYSYKGTCMLKISDEENTVKGHSIGYRIGYQEQFFLANIELRMVDE